MAKSAPKQLFRACYLVCIFSIPACSTSNILKQSDLNEWNPESEYVSSISVLLDNEGVEGGPVLLDESTLIFESDIDGNYNLWSLNLKDTIGLIQLTSYDGQDRLPCAHPDKKRYCFISDRSEVGFFIGEIGKPTVVSLLKLVKPSFGNWTNGDISPDGQLLIYASGKYIWTFNLETNTKTQFVEGTDPKWSPDGQKIIFSKIRKGAKNPLMSSIWMMNSDGTGQTELISESNEYMYSQPKISPDGQKFLYTKKTFTVRPDRISYGNPDIWICNIDGTKNTQITTHPLSDQEGIWLDSNTIIFCSDRPQTGAAQDVKWDLWQLKIR